MVAAGHMKPLNCTEVICHKPLVTLKSILMAHQRVTLPKLQGGSIFRDSRDSCHMLCYQYRKL